MKLTSHTRTMLLLLAALLFLFVPWLGLTPFNTKGEPREAIVAMSMLQSGDWLLPVSHGGDIPYKPPFLAWCIAVCSLITGHVAEFTSRLPSAVAVVCLAMSACCFVRRRLGGMWRGVMTALVMVTMIEVWRAGWACRVDMLLTAFMFGAMVALYRYRASGYRGLPWGAVVLMTGAVLTKGPVGALLPCLVAGVFGLIRGDRFWPLLGRLSVVAVVSMIVPALWYYAAWQEGGDEFYRLMMEENIGRLTGTMSYSSHENPFYYNFVTLIAGVLPYTLLLLMALFGVNWGGLRKKTNRTMLENLWHRLRTANEADVYAVVAPVIVFAFYCIPKSKRSVYLLPMYPFIAYWVVRALEWMIVKMPRAVKTYGGIIASVAVIIGVLVIVGAAVALPGSLSAVSPGIVGTIIGVCVLAGGVVLFVAIRRSDARQVAMGAVGLTMLTLTLLSAAVLPGLLGAKSDLPAACEVERVVPEGVVYGYVAEPLMRFYTINFYLGDRMHRYDDDLPTEGYMLVGKKDMEEWRRIYGEIYDVDTVLDFNQRSCDIRQPFMLVRLHVAEEQ